MQSNNQVDNFIEDILCFDGERGKLLNSLRKIISDISLKVKEEIKYGGIVFIINKKLFSGIFIRKKHISIEFVDGYRMEDADNFLEGIGKYRRHLKIFKKNEVKDKKVKYYVKQAVKLL